jgi:hypothetical protein
MDLELIHGQFDRKDAIDLLTQFFHVKIKFHENKISSESNEEDIKMREKKIKRLQKELFEARTFIELNTNLTGIEATVHLSHKQFVNNPIKS